MKRYLKASAIGLVVLLLFCLFSAVTISADAKQNRPLKIWFENKNGHMQTYCLVDENTGVNYIVVGTELGGGDLSCAITPRLNPDGSLYVTP